MAYKVVCLLCDMNSATTVAVGGLWQYISDI